MRTKILGLLILGLIVGCTGKNPNSGSDGGTGGNGGSGGSGGGDGGMTCVDQCTAGATRCADASNQETCTPVNGCLQWVKSACAASQICKSGANDMGASGGACVTGVPCTCPSGFTCDGNGVCQGGDPSKIPIDVKTVNVGGTITLDGAAPTTNPSCDPDPSAAKATVELTDTARGYSFMLPVPCSSTTFAWSGVVFPGTYTVRVIGAGDYSSLPNQAFVANPTLAVAADTQNVVLDVKTVSVGGTITLNGAAPTTAMACTGNPDTTVATVHFADATDGYAFDFAVPCSSTTYGWGGSIFPGTYVVTVAGTNGLTNLPATPFVFKRSLAVGGTLTNQVIPVVTANVSGNVTLNGAPPTPATICSSYPTYPQATVHLADKTNGYAFDVPILCSSTDYSWTAAVYPGNYSVSVAGQSGYSNLPTQSFVGLSSLQVNGDVSGQTLAVQTNNVAGTVTLNGATPAPPAGCSGNPTYPQATVRLADQTRGYDFSFDIPCSSTTLAWSGVVFPGNYQVSVTGGSYYTSLPTQAYVAQPALAVSSDVSGDTLDVKTVNAGGTITLNGAAPAVSTYCNGNPTTTMAEVGLSDDADGYQFTIQVPCSASSFAWSGTIFPGTYQVRVAGVQGYSNVPTQPFLANAALSARSDVTNQVLDVKTRNVGGSITLNGATPSTSTACNPSPTAAKANVLFEDGDDGYSFTLPIACSAADFSFMGVVYPGTYRISVAGANGYSNLPTESFLGTPRLLVK